MPVSAPRCFNNSKPRLCGELTGARGEIDTLLRLHDGQDFESVPIHPLMAERLRLRFYDPNARYRWHAHEWTFREYILHYARWAPYSADATLPPSRPGS